MDNMSSSASPVKDGALNRNIVGIIEFLNSPVQKSETLDSGTETSDNEPISDILNGVVAYAEVKSNEDNRSRMIGRELVRLGAQVEKRFTKAVTHVVFYNGSMKTRERAEKNGLHLVSVSWIQKCKSEGRRVPEADFPATKMTPPMVGTKRKKFKSMQPIPLEEELARSKERVKRKLNRENRWKTLLEGEAYADFSPSYLSKLKPNPHLVPETPADSGPVKKSDLGASKMDTVVEEGEYVSFVEESPTPSPVVHKRLFDSDDSDDETLPPLWERVKKFVPIRRSYADNDNSGVRSDVSLPKVGYSPESSPTKSVLGTRSPRTGDSASEESLLAAKIGQRRSLGRKALLNSAKKALLQRAVDATKVTLTESPVVVVVDTVVAENKFVSVQRSKLVESSSSESAVDVDGERSKVKRGRRRSSAAPKLAQLVECSESGSDVPKRRKLLRPGDDKLLISSPSGTSSKSECVDETSSESPSAKDVLGSSAAARRRGGRKSVAVSSPSVEKEKTETRRRSVAAVATVPREKETETKRKKMETKAKGLVRSNSPEFEPISVEITEKSANDDASFKKRKRPKFSSSDSDTNSGVKEPETKKCRSTAQANSKTSRDIVDCADITSRAIGDGCKIRPSSILDEAKNETSELMIPALKPCVVSVNRTSTSARKLTSFSAVSDENKEPFGKCYANQELIRRGRSSMPGITLTNLHKEERSTVLSIIKKLGRYHVTDRVDERTTHVICGEKRRTLNVLHAITRGCWLVKKEWVFRSLENDRWVDESSFVLDDDFPSGKMSRSEKLRNGLYKPDLFGSCGGILIHRKTSPPPDELEALVALCNGEVVSTRKNAKISVGKRLSSLVCVTEQWILDSVSSLQCQLFEPYLLSQDVK